MFIKGGTANFYGSPTLQGVLGGTFRLNLSLGTVHISIKSHTGAWASRSLRFNRLTVDRVLCFCFSGLNTSCWVGNSKDSGAVVYLVKGMHATTMVFLVSEMNIQVNAGNISLLLKSKIYDLVPHVWGTFRRERAPLGHRNHHVGSVLNARTTVRIHRGDIF
jgi:hypothetical protein